MIVIDYYKFFKNSFGYIYSLDMVRFNFEFLEDLDKKFENLLNEFNFIYGCNVQQSICKKGIGYKYLYTLSIENNKNKCSFAIGTGLNCKSENKNKGFIEFNPNKCFMLNQFTNFFHQFCDCLFTLQLVRYDCAIDIPLPRNRVKMIHNVRCNFQRLVESDDSPEGEILDRSVTEYQGRRNHNKFTKLYDKTKESRLNYDLTRIEFTFSRSEVDFKGLPDFVVYDDKIIPNCDFTKISSSDLVLIDLLRNSEECNYYLANLPYRKRKKIEPYLGDIALRLDIDLILNVRNLALSFEF